jgi:hypothetical protein
MAALMSRQRPTEDDVAAALEAWSTGAAGQACKKEGLLARRALGSPLPTSGVLV